MNNFVAAVAVRLCLMTLSLNASAALDKDAVPPIKLKYCSVFSQYQAFNDQALAPWRETNDAVATIGGWRAYAKQMVQPDAMLGDKSVGCVVSRKKP